MVNKDKMLSLSELTDMYRENDDLKDYVDRYITLNKISLEEGLSHKMVNYAAQNILGTLKVGDTGYV